MQVQNLEMLLRNEKLKPAEFSRILHIHESQVSDWRSGKHSISVKNANKICAAFPAYDLDFILGNTPYPNKQSEKNDEAYKENSLHEAVELLANRCGVTVTAFCTFDSREYTELYESGQHSTVEIMDKFPRTDTGYDYPVHFLVPRRDGDVPTKGELIEILYFKHFYQMSP